MAINITTISEKEFYAKLAALIGQLEGTRELPYLDTVGIPTIGIGFNLRVENIRKAVFKEMGITGTAMQNTLTAIITAPPAAGQTTLPNNYQQALAPIIATSWQQ